MPIHFEESSCIGDTWKLFLGVRRADEIMLWNFLVMLLFLNADIFMYILFFNGSLYIRIYAQRDVNLILPVHDFVMCCF